MHLSEARSLAMEYDTFRPEALHSDPSGIPELFNVDGDAEPLGLSFSGHAVNYIERMKSAVPDRHEVVYELLADKAPSLNGRAMW